MSSLSDATRKRRGLVSTKGLFQGRAGGTAQNPIQIFAGAQAREQAKVPFDIAAEQRGIDLAGKKEAVTQATKAIAQLTRLSPVIDEFERDFDRVFPKAQSGFSGRLQAGGVVFDVNTLESDPELAAALDSLEGKRSLITKGLGEVGNLAEQEQIIAMQNLPELKFQGLSKLVLPESPAMGKSKLKRFRNFVNEQINKNLEIIQSGGDLSFLGDQPGQQPGSPIPGSPGFQSKKDKLRDRLLAKYGSTS